MKKKLNSEKIKKNINNNIKVYIYDSIDSTNIECKRIIKNNDYSSFVVLSEEQTQGRGRLGRTFYSPKYSGIYLSYAYKIKAINNSVTNITSLVSTIVVKALEKYIKDKLGIKWVNDIYYNNKKVCGILVESVIYDNKVYLIIGIGINISTVEFPDDIKNIAISLNEYDLSRNELICEIVNNLYEYLDDDKYLTKEAKDEYMSFYKEHSIVIGREVEYTENETVKKAKAIDINNDGELIVEDAENKKHILRTGEITLRVVI